MMEHHQQGRRFADGRTTLAALSSPTPWRPFLAAGSKWTDADSHDLWVARLDPDGVVEWEDIVSGGEGDDWATQVAALDGDLVVTGEAFADQLSLPSLSDGGVRGQSDPAAEDRPGGPSRVGWRRTAGPRPASRRGRRPRGR